MRVAPDSGALLATMTLDKSFFGPLVELPRDENLDAALSGNFARTLSIMLLAVSHLGPLFSIAPKSVPDGFFKPTGESMRRLEALKTTPKINGE